MANTLKQSVVQYDLEGVDPRILVQYVTSEGEDAFTQVIVEYDSLTTEQKAVFDSFKDLCESKIV